MVKFQWRMILRINKFLSSCGVSSRRKCDDYIKSRKVLVNGKVITDFSFQVKSNDIVICDGELVEYIMERVLFILNKPKGYICTNSDTHNRKKVIDLIPSKDRLFTIGRLDRDTTGVILVTNDGDLANKLMHPKYKKEKIYFAQTRHDILDKEHSKLRTGLRLDNGDYARGEIKRLERSKGKVLWEVKLKEGKNREVKRIFEAFGTSVVSLHRYSFAGVRVDDLKVGKFKKLNSKKIDKLFKI